MAESPSHYAFQTTLPGHATAHAQRKPTKEKKGYHPRIALMYSFGERNKKKRDKRGSQEITTDVGHTGEGGGEGCRGELVEGVKGTGKGEGGGERGWHDCEDVWKPQ